MKKTYLKPDTLICEVTLQQMIALSKTDTEANPDGEVLSRRRRRRIEWDEEDDEFEDEYF